MRPECSWDPMWLSFCAMSMERNSRKAEKKWTFVYMISCKQLYESINFLFPLIRKIIKNISSHFLNHSPQCSRVHHLLLYPSCWRNSIDSMYCAITENVIPRIKYPLWNIGSLVFIFVYLVCAYTWSLQHKHVVFCFWKIFKRIL